MLPRGYANIELEYLTEQWPEIGDQDFLDEIFRILSDPDNPNNITAEEIGAVMAAEWIRSGLCEDIDEWEEFVTDIILPNHEFDKTDNVVQIFAIVKFVLSLEFSDKRLSIAIDTMLKANNEIIQEIIGSYSLPEIIQSDTPAASLLMEKSKQALKNVKFDHLTVSQYLVFECLAALKELLDIYKHILPEPIHKTYWMNDSALLRLVPMAAMAGLDSAKKLLKDISLEKVELSEEMIDALFGSSALYYTTSDVVYGYLIDIAIKYYRVEELCNFINSADWQDKRMLPHIKRLFHFSKELLKGDEIDQINGCSLLGILIQEADDEDFDWEEYKQILNGVRDVELLCELLPAVGIQTSPDSVKERIAYFKVFQTYVVCTSEEMGIFHSCPIRIFAVVDAGILIGGAFACPSFVVHPFEEVARFACAFAVYVGMSAGGALNERPHVKSVPIGSQQKSAYEQRLFAFVKTHPVFSVNHAVAVIVPENEVARFGVRT